MRSHRRTEWMKLNRPNDNFPFYEACSKCRHVEENDPLRYFYFSFLFRRCKFQLYFHALIALINFFHGARDVEKHLFVRNHSRNFPFSSGNQIFLEKMTLMFKGKSWTKKLQSQESFLGWHFLLRHFTSQFETAEDKNIFI